MRRRTDDARSGPGTRATPNIAVIGGGFGGIAVAYNLKKLGIKTFTVFERSERPGGTWLENDYPGAEVDIDSRLYSFSFKRHQWSRTHARRDELLQYLDDTVDEFALRDHFTCGTAVEKVVWNNKTQKYTLHTSSGAQFEFNVVVSAVGLFNAPRIPSWPGIDEFEGASFHSSRWNHEIDLSGKRVAVVGTGSSSAGIVPAIAGLVEHLYVFQREPGWVLPKGDHDYSLKERSALNRPINHRAARLKLIYQTHGYAKSQFPGTKGYNRLKATALEFLQSTFADRQDLREALTPGYEFFGKRVVRSDTFYPTFLRSNVTLIPYAVETVTPLGVVDATGAKRDIDVLIMATGFYPSNFLSSVEVVGKTGKTLHDHWDGDPRAFLGIMVNGFPNFFMLLGPNTFGGGAGVAFFLERQAEFVAKTARMMTRHSVDEVDVRRGVEDLYDRWLQRKLANSVWATNRNYYKSASGRVVVQYPWSSLLYAVKTRTLRRISMRTRRRRTRSPQTDGLAPANERNSSQRV